MSSLLSDLTGGALLGPPKPASKPELTLLYSKAGSGKSHTAATLSEIPGIGKILYIDVEGSTPGVLNKFDPKKIDVLRIYEVPEERQYKVLTDVLNNLKKIMEEGKYGGVVVDTLNRVQEIIRDGILPLHKDGRQAWGEIGEKTVFFTRVLKALPQPAVIILHQKYVEVPGGGNEISVALQGNIAQVTVPTVPDVVIYLTRKLQEDGTVVTTGEFETQDGKITKNRFGFPAKVQNVNFPALWKFIDTQAEKEKTK